MSSPILVGYDPKTLDRAPVEFGVAAAAFTGAPLVIVSVHGGGAQDLPSRQMREDLVDEAISTLEQVSGALQSQGVAVAVRDVESTSAPRALHELAEAEGAGLLVAGSTRRGTVGRVLPGSTAERLMHGAPCPIGVVPHGWERGGGLATVGVAYVDTEEGREALRGAHALAARAGATLRVLTVEHDRGLYAQTEPTTAERSGKGYEDVVGEHRVMAEAAAQRAVAQLGGDVAVEVDAFAEDPADTLIRVSENLDLLICGSRGYGPARAVLLGVSRRVTAEAHCPVIVLPRGVRASLESLVEETPASRAST